MSSFTVTVKDDDLKQALAALQQRLNNMQPAMEEIGEDLMERTKYRFETSMAPDGTPWQPLSAVTKCLFNPLQQLCQNGFGRYRGYFLMNLSFF